MKHSIPSLTAATLVVGTTLWVTATNAFTVSPQSIGSLWSVPHVSPLFRATVVPDAPTIPTSTNPVDAADGSDMSPSAWDCDDDANCVQVPACDEEQCRTSLDVRIHNTWYDLSGWMKAHPAGANWIEWYDGRDATEVMDAFHSQKARGMYKRLPKSTEANTKLLESTVPPDSKTQLAFRKLVADLEKEGFWKRDMVHEFTQLGIWAALVGAAAVTASALPFVSTCLLAVSMTAAGWLGHDYIHGRSCWRRSLFVRL